MYSRTNVNEAIHPELFSPPLLCSRCRHNFQTPLGSRPRDPASTIRTYPQNVERILTLLLTKIRDNDTSKNEINDPHVTKQLWNHRVCSLSKRPEYVKTRGK